MGGDRLAGPGDGDGFPPVKPKAQKIVENSKNFASHRVGGYQTRFKAHFFHHSQPPNQEFSPISKKNLVQNCHFFHDKFVQNRVTSWRVRPGVTTLGVTGWRVPGRVTVSRRVTTSRGGGGGRYIHTNINAYIHTSIHPSIHPNIHTCMHA